MMIRIVVLGIVALNAWAGIRAGAATVDITPPPGAAMSGYFFNRSATGTHDPLFARALVFENEGVKIALVSCDLTSMPEGIATEARRLIGRYSRIVEPSAEGLWLGIRIERKLGDKSTENSYANQLRRRFPSSREYQQMQRGEYD